MAIDNVGGDGDIEWLLGERMYHRQHVDGSKNGLYLCEFKLDRQRRAGGVIHGDADIMLELRLVLTMLLILWSEDVGRLYVLGERLRGTTCRPQQSHNLALCPDAKVERAKVEILRKAVAGEETLAQRGTTLEHH
jgi:hypothetical protein